MRKSLRDTVRETVGSSSARTNKRTLGAANRRPAQESVARRAFNDPDSLNGRDVLRLQKTFGNRAVTQLLLAGPRQRKASGSVGGREVTRPSASADAGRTGLPDALRAGIENLSGVSMSDVQVHYNSPEPARLRALAHTRGNEIHLGPGQEKHLPHEAWHAVQQKQGRVRPTGRLRGGAVNEDALLEREADSMGARAQTASSDAPPDAGRENLPKRESSYGGEGVIQGVFVYNRDIERFVDTDTGYSYMIMGTINYGVGRRAYQLRNTQPLLNEYVDIDATTLERVNLNALLPPSPTLSSFTSSSSSSSSFSPPPPSSAFEPLSTSIFGTTTPVPTLPPTGGLPLGTDERGIKRKRLEEEADDSEFEPSDDDETTELTASEKVKVLSKQGAKKRSRLLTRTIEKEGKKFPMHDPRSRKVYSAHRSSRKAGSVSDITRQENLLIGPQVLRVGEGTGYFIQPGGNKSTRPEGIKEPPADYSGLFEGMKLMGNDPNSAALYKLATGRELTKKSTLSDEAVAAIALYYMNHDASVIHASLKRSQLTEHLAKLTIITNISEFARALEATGDKAEMPYDATLLIKRGLQVVAEGTKTLREVFYQGKGGEKSIFMGAPSQENSPSKIGGAEVLRNPLSYIPRLERQMSIFPNRKKEYKASLNALKSQARIALPEMTEERRSELEESYKAEQVAQARALVREIKSLALPTSGLEVNDYVNTRGGPIKKYTSRINAMRKTYADNKAALKALTTARSELKKKEEAAKAVK